MHNQNKTHTKKTQNVSPWRTTSDGVGGGVGDAPESLVFWGVFGVARCYARTSTMSREYYRYVDVCGVYAMALVAEKCSLHCTHVLSVYYTSLHLALLCIYIYMLYTGRRIHQHVYTELTQMFYPLAYYKITGYVLTKPPVHS